MHIALAGTLLDESSIGWVGFGKTKVLTIVLILNCSLVDDSATLGGDALDETTSSLRGQAIVAIKSDGDAWRLFIPCLTVQHPAGIPFQTAAGPPFLGCASPRIKFLTF